MCFPGGTRIRCRYLSFPLPTYLVACFGLYVVDEKYGDCTTELFCSANTLLVIPRYTTMSRITGGEANIILFRSFIYIFTASSIAFWLNMLVLANTV
ncbi:hypothetical protein MT325_m386R [Paramecium bursaria chlorella virus MT325]|uniref:Uncharacterized protein m386R n=1 Tax=Paramecium bursaria Chlorella virus MT325 TaxID=346932 RepID=A7IUB6_PBCVM|nr:hypothetical protein MT325_m386R [Paramecium bursaria chlorella virus MT325]